MRRRESTGFFRFANIYKVILACVSLPRRLGVLGVGGKGGGRNTYV